MHKVKYVVAVVLLCGAVGPAVARTFPLPFGWHTLRLVDFKNTDDYHFRLQAPGGGLEAVGDFDGDGRMDTARVLESTDRKHCAVFLTYFPDGKVAQRQIRSLDSSCLQGNPSLFVLSLKPQGTRIKTWCGKKVFCEKGDTDYIKPTLTSLMIGFYEASYSIMFWNLDSHRWRMALISD